jgi:hypothetical protein
VSARAKSLAVGTHQSFGWASCLHNCGDRFVLRKWREDPMGLSIHKHISDMGGA